MAAAKFPALAITDHGNLYGAIEFYSMCTEVGIKPIIGMESYIAPQSRLDRSRGPSEASNHLTLLAINETGYRNFMKLVFPGVFGRLLLQTADRQRNFGPTRGRVGGVVGVLKGEVPGRCWPTGRKKPKKRSTRIARFSAKKTFLLS
jgi:hypothetical protein